MKSIVAAVLYTGLLVTAPLVHAEEGEPVYPHRYTHPYSHDDPALTARPRNPYARDHFYLGAEAVFIGVAHETAQREFLRSAGGFDISVGGRVHRRLAIELNWMSTFHEDRTTLFRGSAEALMLNAVTLDFKIFVWYRGRVQPYVAVGGGAYFLGKGYTNLDTLGPGFEAGGGIDFWLWRHLSLGVKAQYRGIGMLDYKVFHEESYISAVTLGGDLTARF